MKAAESLKKAIDQAQTDSKHPLNRKTRVRKGWILPTKSTFDGNIVYIEPFLLHNQSFDGNFGYFLFVYSFTVSLPRQNPMVRSILSVENDSTAKVKIEKNGKLFRFLSRKFNGKHLTQKWFQNLLDRPVPKSLKYTVRSLFTSSLFY